MSLFKKERYVIEELKCFKGTKKGYKNLERQYTILDTKIDNYVKEPRRNGKGCINCSDKKVLKEFIKHLENDDCDFLELAKYLPPLQSPYDNLPILDR